MNEEQLLDYLLGALDGPESQAIEQELADNPALMERLEACRCRLRPLDLDRCSAEIVPAGLADRTCGALWPPALRLFGYDAPAWTTRSWGLVDALVAVAVSLCGVLLVIPAIANSRYLAQRLMCQKNLAQIGSALSLYADHHEDRFPCPAASGNAQIAGAVALQVRDAGFLPDDSVLFCPGDASLSERPVELPTYATLVAAEGPAVAELQRAAGGSYGYTLGVLEGRDLSTWRGVKNLHRAEFALVADSPRWHSAKKMVLNSRNHGGDGQNVLFENLGVKYTVGNVVGDDHLMLNDEQRIGPGLHMRDAVIGSSEVSAAGFVPALAP